MSLSCGARPARLLSLTVSLRARGFSYAYNVPDRISIRIGFRLHADHRVSLDALFGDPKRIYDRVPHPVVLIGRIIERLDQSLNDPESGDATRKISGVLAVLVVVAGCAFLGWLIGWGIREVPISGNWIVEAVLVSSLLAFRDLYNYVLRVAVGLEENLESGRAAVKHIVGRDPDTLDEAGVARATIESAAENFSDGFVAPVFFYVLFGLPGIFAYKAINTLDSMIGYKSEKYRAFGWAAARLDDVANWPAARLSGLAFIAASFFIYDTCWNGVPSDDAGCA